jgi:hypothetical protein
MFRAVGRGGGEVGCGVPFGCQHIVQLASWLFPSGAHSAAYVVLDCSRFL